MICSKCGEELPDNSLFCLECGAKVEIAATSKKSLEIIILPAVVIVGLVAAVIVLFSGTGAGDTFDFVNGNVSETSDISEPGQSSTNSEQPPQSTDSKYDTPSVSANGSVSETSDISEPEQSSTNSEQPPQSAASTQSDSGQSDPNFPAYGSMGSVMILDVEYDIATTTALYLIVEDITDDELKQIAQLTNLSTLYLDYNYISDITPLTGLTKLTKLQLQSNRISDITPLSGLTNLKSLSLSANQISDITPLSELTKLTTLDLSSNQISDLSPLSGLTNLNKLTLYANQISDLTPLSGLTNLTTLNLNYNLISDSDIEQLKTKLPDCDISFKPYIRN